MRKKCFLLLIVYILYIFVLFRVTVTDDYYGLMRRNLNNNNYENN